MTAPLHFGGQFELDAVCVCGANAFGGGGGGGGDGPEEIP
eukprot:CAMPEP_0115868566 /NCGR_PEP_ID=MMETSP0287-20121206/21360_1 /TAXON_ID=412157 /ORGANISM="Chrysochromulina rotalis, Strain UIO044" /LENGTH=39 /DNA_ID= /DNA_START= /DNA_END= /DNA_ORIENTATION=